MDDNSVSRVDTGPDRVSWRTTVDRPVIELFDEVANPWHHHRLDGSGTVTDTVAGPPRLSADATFSVKMKQFGVPYKITSRVTEFEPERVIEWRHPMGHRWRWEFEPVGGDDANPQTQVTETFDFSGLGLRTKSLKLFGYDKKNSAGIQNTLRRLHDPVEADPAE
jgi:hypothetical protein